MFTAPLITIPKIWNNLSVHQRMNGWKMTWYKPSWNRTWKKITEWLHYTAVVNATSQFNYTSIENNFRKPFQKRWGDGFMDMYGWVPSLFTWDYHNTVNRLSQHKIKSSHTHTHRCGEKYNEIIQTWERRKHCYLWHEWTVSALC